MSAETMHLTGRGGLKCDKWSMLEYAVLKVKFEFGLIGIFRSIRIELKAVVSLEINKYYNFYI